MKFNTENAPEQPNEGVQVGDVYSSKQHRVTRWWVVVAIRDDTVVCLGLNEIGEITTGTNYRKHVFEGGCCWKGRQRLGRVKDLDLSLNIEWETLP